MSIKWPQYLAIDRAAKAAGFSNGRHFLQTTAKDVLATPGLRSGAVRSLAAQRLGLSFVEGRAA